MQLFSWSNTLFICMRIFFGPIISLFLLASNCSAQTYLEPILGSRIGLNNAAYKFFQLNIGAQYTMRKSKYYEIILQAMLSMPIAKNGLDQAYTLNPALPLSINVMKTIKPYTFSISLGHRIILAGAKRTNQFAILLYAGLVNENMAVNYDNDKENYIILNPDKSQKRLSLFINAGLEFIHQLPKGKIFWQVTISTPPFGGSIKYPATFGYITPLCLNIGYSIPLRK